MESLRYVLVAEAPVVPSLIRAFLEKPPHVEVREGWGMSELSPAVCFSPQGGSVVGSCGKVLPNTQVKLINVETGESLGPGEAGELLVRGPQVMKGYLNNPKATQNTLRDGWLVSGDIAYRDKDGNISMVDRMKEMIKVKALQVSPSELEDVLRQHPEVLDAAVLGFSDERMGEVPRAFIVKTNRKKPFSSFLQTLSEDLSMHPRLVVIHLPGHALWFCDILSRQYDNVTVERSDTAISKEHATMIPTLKAIKPGAVLKNEELVDLFATKFGPELMDTSNSDYKYIQKIDFCIYL